MKVTLASSYGFCFGVKRAIEIAEKHKISQPDPKYNRIIIYNKN